MKKIISLALILIFAFSLVSCKRQTQTPPGDVDIGTVKEIDFTAQYVRANVEYTPNLPYAEVISSKAELDAYVECFAVDVTSESDGSISFNTAAEKYTDDYFTKNQLVLCMISESSGSIRHKAEKVQLINDIELDISIKRDIPEAGTADMALWHIFVETEKLNVADESIEIIVDGKSITNPTDISYANGAIGISLTLKKGWQHKTVEQNGEYGIEISPKGQEGTVRIIYRDTPLGLCGTGLTTDTVTIGQYTATTYKYDDIQNYFMANFKTASGGYYIENNGADDWWSKYEIEALEILNTLVLSDTAMTRDVALKIAKEKTTREYTAEFVNYDAINGNWVVTLKNSEWTETYKINEHGSSMTATPTKEE